MSPHPLANFEKQKNYQNEPKFYSVYSRKNLTKVKDGVYVINRDECKSKKPDWIAIFVKNDVTTYFDSFGIEYIPK